MPAIDTFSSALGSVYSVVDPLTPEDEVSGIHSQRPMHPIFGNFWQLVEGETVYATAGAYTRELLLEYPWVWEGTWGTPPPELLALVHALTIELDYTYSTDLGGFAEKFDFPRRGSYARRFAEGVEILGEDEAGNPTPAAPPATALPLHRYLNEQAPPDAPFEERVPHEFPHLSRSLLSKRNLKYADQGGLQIAARGFLWSHSDSANSAEADEPLPTGAYFPADPGDPEEEYELETESYEEKSWGLDGQADFSGPIYHLVDLRLWALPILAEFSFSTTTGKRITSLVDPDAWSAEQLETINEAIATYEEDNAPEIEAGTGYYGFSALFPEPPFDATDPAEPSSDISLAVRPATSTEYRVDFLDFEKA